MSQQWPTRIDYAKKSSIYWCSDLEKAYMFAFKEPSENLKSGCSKGIIQKFQQCNAETKTKYETFVGPQFSVCFEVYSCALKGC